MDRSELGIITVRCRPCGVCGEVNEVEVIEEHYLRWKEHHVAIQEALPELTPDKREMLMTGFCDACFHSLWADESD